MTTPRRASLFDVLLKVQANDEQIQKLSKDQDLVAAHPEEIAELQSQMSEMKSEIQRYLNIEQPSTAQSITLQNRAESFLKDFEPNLSKILVQKVDVKFKSTDEVEPEIKTAPRPRAASIDYSSFGSQDLKRIAETRCDMWEALMMQNFYSDEQQKEMKIKISEIRNQINQNDQPEQILKTMLTKFETLMTTTKFAPLSEEKQQILHLRADIQARASLYEEMVLQGSVEPGMDKIQQNSALLNSFIKSDKLDLLKDKKEDFDKKVKLTDPMQQMLIKIKNRNQRLANQPLSQQEDALLKNIEESIAKLNNAKDNHKENKLNILRATREYLLGDKSADELQKVVEANKTGKKMFTLRADPESLAIKAVSLKESKAASVKQETSSLGARNTTPRLSR